MNAPNGDPILVSVVITTHNEGRFIRETISGLAKQNGLGRGAVEVVLVDDRSADNTVAQARAANHPALVVFHSNPDPELCLTTRQQALDLGFRQARGKVTVTLDGDSILPEGWLAAMVAPILAGQADGVAGPVGFHAAGNWIGTWQSCDAAYYFQVCLMLNRLGGSGGIFFGNFAFRTEAYQELGGFSAIGFALTEDLAFAQALNRAGARIDYLSGHQRVQVKACPDLPALVDRTLRVTSGPPSVLAAVLTLWPMTLLALVAATLAGVSGAGWFVLARYGLGAGFAFRACTKHAGGGAMLFAPLYEPAVFILAVAALARRALGYRVNWGGKTYD